MARGLEYAGKLLRVDLSRRDISESSPLDYARRFLGGRGIAAKIYWDEVPPETKALDPDNKLIFTTGPLTGFPGLAGSRWQICGKSPVTNPEFFSYANLGGSWGAHLKFAGYDGIIVQGRSDKPVYLLIQDGNIEIKDASAIWGKSTVETREALKSIHGRDTKVVATGPAGEKLVNMAIVLADDDSAGSAGFGAVMGAKKLKAIAVKGTKKPAAANSEALTELRKHLRESRKDAPGLWACGYHSPFLEENPKFKQFVCWGCISGCSRAVYTADDGKKGKFTCQAPFIYRDYALNYYGKDTDIPFYAARFCDEYGLDVIGIGTLIAWLRRCFRAGILNDDNTGIPVSKVGSLEFIEALVRKTALRDGFGDVLAHGLFAAADIVGGKAKEQLGADFWKTGHYYLYAPKLYIITGMLYATEPRVPIQQLHQVSFIMHHWLDWYNKAKDAFVSTEVLRGSARRFLGDEATFDFSTYDGKALAAVKLQEREYAKECLILCDFAWPMRYIRHSADHIGDPTIESRILSAVSGKEMGEAELCHIGERVFNLQRAILSREGHGGRQGDALPESDYTVPLKYERGNPECILPGKGDEIISRKGAVIDREKFEKVKDEYYQLRGWDVKTGLQTKAKLEALELNDIIPELRKRGLLVV